MGVDGHTRNSAPSARTDRGGPADEPIRVLIVDDHLLFADAIRWTLEADGMEVIATVATAGDAIRVFREERPNLVLVDMALPDQSGLAVGQAMIEDSPHTVVIALTALDDPQLVKQAIGAGFRGYVSKDCPVSQLRASIADAIEGRIVVRSRPMSGGSGGSRRDGVSLLAGQLTPREREVLALLAQGASSSEMARRLGISPNTLRTHVQSVLTKLQVHSRLEAATFAVRNDLIRDGDPRRGSSDRRSGATWASG